MGQRMKTLMLPLLTLTASTSGLFKHQQRHQVLAAPDVPAFVERIEVLRKAANTQDYPLPL